MEQDLKNIINISISAPSGDNSQPWAFKIKNNIVSVYNVPDKDQSLYNFKMGASLIAIGALLENIKISAAHFGYSCEIEINADEKEDLVARCVFSEQLVKDDVLFEYIKKRETNRKPYRKEKITSSVVDEINSIVLPDGIGLKIVADDRSIGLLADASSVNEQVVLENQKLHDFLFEHITWDEQEDEKKKGFYIKTLELNKPQNFAFKLLRSWKVNNFLNKFGISKLVAKDNAKLYSASGDMLAILNDKLDRISYLHTGMVMQRFWLVATKHGVSVQPLTGVTFLYNRINDTDNTEQFENKHVQLIKSAYSVIEKIIIPETKNKFIAIMFRLGYADKPSSRTKRQDAEITIEK